jgi:4-amino-4-deoxy-L-arabinose transferase-like glycosyltransferase
MPRPGDRRARHRVGTDKATMKDRGAGFLASSLDRGGASPDGVLTHIQWLALVTVLVNASAMLSPIIHSGDAVIYASIARHIAVSGDWARLVLDGHDWLDKPHFPFWVTALSFKLGGVSALTYILPGFLFHLLGAYYTYRLAGMLYDRHVAMLAMLIYVSTFSLMDSSIEIKAEAYLRAEIVGACYYWMRYDRQCRVNYLLLGALYTGMAIMTKGIFALFTISSGFVCLWVYQGQWSKLFSSKWLAALILSLLAAVPELLALHVQFDQDPGDGAPSQHDSALKFFFWDSQFGRFFNTGPIQNHNGYPLYYVLVVIWAFLPWTLFLFAAIHRYFRNVAATGLSERAAFVFVGSMFACTFLLFSATRFQMAYYIDIILPFAAILAANYLSQATLKPSLFAAQACVLLLLASLVIGLSLYVMNTALLATVAAMGIGLCCYVYVTRAAARKLRLICCSVLVINMVYLFSILMTSAAFTRFSLASQAAQLFGAQSATPIYVYQMPEVARELALYSKAPTHELDAVDSVARIPGSYYLIIRDEQARQLPFAPAKFAQVARMNLVIHKTGTLNKLLRLARGTWPLESVDFLEHVTP